MTDVSLPDYVKDVCLGIVEGVRAAQSDSKNGQYIGVLPDDVDAYARTTPFVTKVKFSVAAEASKSSGSSGKISIKVVGADIGSATGTVMSNNISFEVPVAIPMPEKLAEQKAQESNRQNEALGMTYAPNVGTIA